jgi:hypothetical protein
MHLMIGGSEYDAALGAQLFAEFAFPGQGSPLGLMLLA